MTKKNWWLVVVLAVLASVYVVGFSGWLKPRTIRIMHTVRDLHFRRRGSTAKPVVMFALNSGYRLTEIKVVPLDVWRTNHDVLPLWHLVSPSNSVPVRHFIYGQFIRGLKPAVAGTRPEPLKTNVTYRLFLVAGRIKGQHDFKLR